MLVIFMFFHHQWRIGVLNYNLEKEFQNTALLYLTIITRLLTIVMHFRLQCYLYDVTVSIVLYNITYKMYHIIL